MLLKNEDMQKIVDRVIGIVGKNINIMDKNGIIIASGDLDRLGSYHEAAKLSANSKKTITITNTNMNLFKGCKPGINVPIYHENKVIGVVGITGQAALVEGYGQIVKELVELLIQEEERKTLEIYHKRAINSFIKELINKNAPENLDVLKWRSEYLNFDYSVNRFVIIADISNFNNNLSNNSKRDFTSEIEVQKLKQNILDTINIFLGNNNDFAINLNNDRYIILKSANIDINDFLIRLNKLLKRKFNLIFHFSIGEECLDTKDYSKSFKTANKLINLGKKMHPKNLIYDKNQYKLHLFYDSISEESKKDFLSTFPQLFNDKPKDNIINILKTVKIYFENKMSIKETSEKMYIHRNTIIYRFKKLNEIYNIDVSDSYQCMLLYNCIILAELEGMI
ncbi:CdaR family transcriptional regulator [Clostridium sp. DL1XJH146]